MAPPRVPRFSALWPVGSINTRLCGATFAGVLGANAAIARQPSDNGVRSSPMTIAAGIELPESAIADICRLHEVKELSLFGSAARGEMRPDSDFDLLVDFLPGHAPGCWECRQ